jgi:sugar O-acyltransferase (sialic acid O-acetyltransferase NeuD family)
MTKTSTLPVVVIGFGGHGRVVTDALLAAGRTVVAVTDRRPENEFARRLGVTFLIDDVLLRTNRPETIELASGRVWIWPGGKTSHRQAVVWKFQHLGYRFTGFVHLSAWVSPLGEIDPTAQVHAGVEIQAGSKVGAHPIIITSASITRDSHIGCFCKIGPRVTLSGSVQVGYGCHLGTGCSVIQGIDLGAGCFVAAGSTVVQSLGSGAYVRGTPAKQFQPQSPG